MTDNTPAERLEYLRGELRAERMSYGELAELQGLTFNVEHIDPSDVELLEAAGVPEHASVTTQPRDQDVAVRIAEIEGRIESAMREMRDLVDHARQNEAEGHAALYEAVRENLKSARDIVDEAAEIMRGGDPEDYA